MVQKILLIGGGGHCHSVLDSILSNGNYDRIGIVAKDSDNYQMLNCDDLISEYLVGVDADLPLLFDDGWNNAFVSLGSIGDASARMKTYKELLNIGFSIPAVIDNTAVVSRYSKIYSGVFIGINAIVNAGCIVKQCAIVNSGAIIEHDCSIGEFCHISPGAVICGGVSIGSNTHLGAGAIVKQGIVIGENDLIGAGSVVVEDIQDNVKAFGNPCRVKK